MKKQRNGGGSARLPVEKPIGRQLRDTQSEIADYGYGRRSCDTDPRFSLDAGRFSLDAGRFSVDIGRISLDDPRYSFDEPRASWDGYMIGRTTLFPPARVPPPPSMLSVMEDAQVHRHVTRSDMQIPVEEPPPPAANPESNPFEPGGSVQTRDYYTDSSSRRRKSLDRSSSIRKTAAAVVAEMDEVKPVSNSKLSPAITMDSYGNSVIDDWSMDTTETAMNGERNNNNNKKSKRWSKWSILGFIYKKSVNVNKYDDEEEDERYNKRNGTVERSWSESWSNGGLGFNNPKMMRSNSNVSWRKSNGGWLERNKSLKDKENGMLRFYLTPVNGNRRSSRVGGDGNGWEKTEARTNGYGHSMARTVKRLY